MYGFDAILGPEKFIVSAMLELDRRRIPLAHRQVTDAI
jgi:hypothetical protein